MRRLDSPEEYPANAAELVSPAPEDIRPQAPELTAPAPEFFSGDTSAGSEAGRKRRLRHFMAVPAMILSVFLFLHSGTAQTVPSGPAPEPEPGGVEIADTYPLGKGDILITVYNDTISFSVPNSSEFVDEPITILDQVRISESDFTEYSLPAYIGRTSFIFRGWTVHWGNPFDFGFRDQSASWTGEPVPDALKEGTHIVFTVGDVLTREDVERIPPSADGTRYVNIHAMWILEDQYNTKTPIIFHESETEEWEYGSDTPAFSEGYTYLAAFPEPEMEGYEFEGWYDEDGNRVEFLSYYEYYDYSVNPDGSAAYNWDSHHAIHLYAHWKKL